MAKANVVMIKHIEVKENDIEKAKKIFGVKDNAKVMKKALDVIVSFKLL